MSVNTEVFIKTVQNYPVLYDTSHKEYKNNIIKNKIWDSIAEIIGQSDGDTLKKQWKNLRDAYSKHLRSCKTSTGQAAKHIDRYKTWPWVNQMSFLRPHLEFAETSSNVQRNTEEPGPSQAIDRTPPINTDLSQPSGLPLSLQSDTHVHTRRKRTSDGTLSQVDKVIDFISKNTEEADETDLLFKSYAKKLEKMSVTRQALVKFEIAKIMLKAELEESNEMQLLSDDGNNPENMVMTVQQPLTSASSDVNDSITIVSTPSPASESVDLPPSAPQIYYIEPSHNQPLLTQPSHSEPSRTQPSLTQPSYTQRSLTQTIYTQSSQTQPLVTQPLYPQQSYPQSLYSQIPRTQTQIKKTRDYYERFENNK